MGKVEAAFRGRVIRAGEARGEALVSSEPVGFFGMMDPGTGVVTEPGHPLQGRSVAGKVLVFPRGKGSTVGSYVLYALRWNGVAPAALVMASCEPIVAVGAIIAGIPAVDGVEVSAFETGDRVELADGAVRILAVP